MLRSNSKHAANRVCPLKYTGRANLHKWGLAQSPSCDFRDRRQTMNHIVDTCTLTKFECGPNLLQEAEIVVSKQADVDAACCYRSRV